MTNPPPIEQGTLRFEEYIPHPVARVWQALTDPTLHAKWWAAGDVRPVVGHRFDLDMGERFGKQACEVIEVELERRFSYTFAPGTLNTTLTWTLQPEGDGTRLTLEHRGFDLSSPLGKAAMAGMGAGWPGILKRIGTAIASTLEE